MKRFDLSEISSILARSPDVLDALLNDAPDRLVHQNEGKGSWSPFDVVGHLIHGEKTDWIPRAKIILGEAEDKTFKSFEREAMFEASEGKSMNDLLSEFRARRMVNVQTLQSMDPDEQALNRTGIHPDLGEVTLRQLLSTWAVHDLSHIAQISRVIGKQFRDEVGPWEAYLPILHDRE